MLELNDFHLKKYYRYSLYPCTLLQWNALPLELKLTSDITSFRFLVEVLARAARQQPNLGQFVQ